jgi:hypothetical protein
MLADQSITTITGSISFGLEADESIKSVIAFLRINLPKFAAKKDKQKVLPEESTNQLLCSFLNKEAKKYPFRFQPEYIENLSSGRSPKVDFGTLTDSESILISDKVYSENDSFFSFEAKRLPTPGSNREKEYVSGSGLKATGGIERFKKSIHGSGIKYAAIIGYVEAKDFKHWFLNINSWIEELAIKGGIWSKNDALQCSNIDNQQFIELYSEHLRVYENKKASKVYLYHFWINLICPDINSVN